ncbi:hypothetical protein HMPREF0645_1576 [Hallella bergensis DSM 17361]|uniref:Transposase IS66 C-terminal domain-containing protein n=1 Tax=Hallella bergensis DSM 17361 TaxID=585502 RepID=D1PX91_9BACT|nr:hypothetical protein [Hallella bergensis]EFA44051.1 hypothetical protein HMPREF0645_1576 [Hallella bergensis DSM 17361]
MGQGRFPGSGGSHAPHQRDKAAGRAAQEVFPSQEQAIRPITLGGKNYLFCGNNEGAENNAIFYTFMACCRQAGLQPSKWMREFLSKPLPDMTEEEHVNLLPTNFK